MPTPSPKCHFLFLIPFPNKRRHSLPEVTCPIPGEQRLVALPLTSLSIPNNPTPSPPIFSSAGGRGSVPGGQGAPWLREGAAMGECGLGHGDRGGRSWGPEEQGWSRGGEQRMNGWVGVEGDCRVKFQGFGAREWMGCEVTVT